MRRLQWSHTQTSVVSCPDFSDLMPRLQWSRAQTSVVLCADFSGLIPRLQWSRAQTSVGLVPRLQWSRAQTSLVSCPDFSESHAQTSTPSWHRSVCCNQILAQYLCNTIGQFEPGTNLSTYAYSDPYLSEQIIIGSLRQESLCRMEVASFSGRVWRSGYESTQLVAGRTCTCMYSLECLCMMWCFYRADRHMQDWGVV